MSLLAQASKAKSQELSCTNVITMLNYLERDLPAVTVRREIEALGLPIEYLRNKKNWVSYEYYNRFLDKMVSLTGDPQSPYKAPIEGRPQDVFEYVVYATQSVLWYGVLSIPYRLILGSNLYKRWTKIGDFEVISSTTRSMRVRLSLHKGYRQTKNNCLAVRGLLACIPTAVGMPPAKVEEISCAAEGHASCEYVVKWTNIRSRFGGWWLVAIGASLILELVAFRNIFNPLHAVITVLSIATISFASKSYRYWKNLREQEHVSIQRNQYLLDNLAQLESNFRELEQTKTDLLDRNIYLSILGSVSEIINHETHLHTLLLKIARLIEEQLEVPRVDFLVPELGDTMYRSIRNPARTISEQSIRNLVPADTHIALESVPVPTYRPLFIDLETPVPERGYLYLVSLSTPELTIGYLLTYSEKAPKISHELMASLYSNLAKQLRIAYAKITSASTIENILASIPEYVLIFETTGLTVRYANSRLPEAIGTLLAARNPNVVGSRIFDILDFDEETADTIRRLIADLDNRGDSETVETTVGSTVLEFSVFSIPRTESGERLAGLILNDITEERSFHQKLLVSEKLLALGRVAGGIAHEINNPLYAILSNAEEISEDDAVGAESRRAADEIIDHVETISSVVRDLSTYSKTLRNESVDLIDLNQTIEEALKLVRYGADFLEVDVVTNLGEVAPISAIRGEIQQILINLINNAVWAMKNGGTLEITTRQSSGEVVVIVRDTGVGIPSENLDRIFHYLFTTKEAGEGTGQGLSIVDRLVRRNHGSVTVESEVGVGTTFRIAFPARS